MHAKDFIVAMTEALRRRGDVTVDLHPLQHRKGAFEFLRAVSHDIGPNDRVLFVAAGVHGDEVSGPLTLLRHCGEFFERAHAAGLKVVMYPLRNPSGFEAGVRYNIDGDNGDVGNNDFLRYLLPDGRVVDDLAGSDAFASWEWSSEARFGTHLATETALMHELMQKDPLSQVVACIDLHQDLITQNAPAAAYQYAFGDFSRYTPIIERIRTIVPVLAETPIGAGYHVAIDKQGAVTGDESGTEAAMMTDKEGFIARHDGSLVDLLWRLGAVHAVTPETTGATSLDDAIAVNMAWIEGLIELCALRRE